MTSRRQLHDSVEEVLRQDSPAPEDLLRALAGIPILRTDLDSVERAVIDAARAAGVSWTDVATALGLRSRQAAEQRRLRLEPTDAPVTPVVARARRRRQQTTDRQAGQGVVELRRTTGTLAVRLADLGGEDPAVRLAGATLRIAADAEPGAMVDLVRLALADLASAQPQIRARLRGAAAQVRRALEGA